jgi:biopolymer transport protein ExbD
MQTSVALWSGGEAVGDYEPHRTLRTVACSLCASKRKGFSHAHAGPESHGIDLAPMLDFVVNLLIFFILTAVFVKQTGIAVERPAAGAGTAKPSKSIVVDARGEISIDDKTR